MSDTEPPETLEEIEGRFAECMECGGSVDTHEPGVYKTPSDQFKHILCEELGTHPPQYQLEGVDGNVVHTNTQYKCGHVLYGPPIDAPESCPVCTVTDSEVTRIDES